MADTPMGFDAFVAKWVPSPPAWADPGAAPAWRQAATEEGRRGGYREQMAAIGATTLRVPAAVEDHLRRDAAAEVPLLDTLGWLLAEPEMPDRNTAALLVQRVFGVPSTRARYISSWRPGNRREEARRVLERVALCIADARRAGLWESPGKPEDVA